jgi:general secretion pathway protein K
MHKWSNSHILLEDKQRGVAMLIVLFALILITILTTGMIDRQSLFIYKSSFIFDQAQANEYCLAAETFARQVLEKDYNLDKKNGKMIDGPKDIWAQRAVAFPVDYGLIDLQLDDLQGRINLNDVVTRTGALNPIVSDRLKNLLQILSITSITVEKIKDWIDPDNTATGATGAEDSAYLGLSPPYRAANQPFVSLSELRLLFEVTDEDIQKIMPYVTVLPQGVSGINVNTAPIDVLRSLGKKPLSAQDAKTLYDKIQQKSFASVTDFLQAPELAGSGIDKNNAGLTVNSEYFQLSTRVDFSGTVSRLKSIIYRNSKNGKMAILQRDMGQKYLINKQHAKVSS